MSVLRNIFFLFSILMIGMLHVSCDVHEFPDEGLEHEVVLVLSFDRELPIYKTVELNTKVPYKSWTKVSDDQNDYDLRHVLQIYRADRNGKFDRNVFRRMIIVRDDVNIMTDSVRLSLPAGEYRFITWSDHTVEGELDFFYNTLQFDEISLQGEYIGCNDMRDAFTGTQEQEIISSIVNVVPVRMSRPLAKYTFISTDFEEFKTRVLEALAVKGETTKAIDLNEFKVEFSYSGFMPSSYNLHTMKPADAKTGVSFETRMSKIDEYNAKLGFDYVFVNGSDASVNVQITTYDTDGSVIARSDPFEVPLAKSQHTIIKGKFLTALKSGSVGIDPEFDGEFNIIIP